jgi:competence protein ComEC
MSPHPAFFYGLFALLGAAFSIAPHLVYLLPLALLLFYLKSVRKILVAVSIMGLFFVMTEVRYSFPDLEKETVGQGEFVIDSLSLESSPFAKAYVFRGSLKQFESNDGTKFQNVPCRIYIPQNKKRPLGGSFSFQGRLIKKREHHYVLKLKTWAENTGGIAETRFQAKRFLERSLTKNLPVPQVRSFLLSMLTGDIDDYLMMMEFNKVGLQHILGVSGFQFVLLASLLGMFLSFLFPGLISRLALLVLLSLYFFFLGDSPPVLRAFVAISLFIIGQIFNRKITPLNALGVGLIVEIVLHPLVIKQIGFQLSFVCTFAILTLYPLFRHYFKLYFPERRKHEILTMSLFQQHGYIASYLIRESLALNFAVHLMALPLLLTLFGKFPLLSLIYNLFFPACAALLFTMLLLGFIIPGLHLVTDVFTEKLLTLTSHPPPLLDLSMRMPDFPLTACVIALTLLYLLAMLANGQVLEKSTPFATNGA